MLRTSSTRYWPGECTSVRICWRAAASRVLVASDWAKPRKLLFAGQPLVGRRERGPQRGMPGIIGRGQAGIVGDILAKGLLSVHRQVGEGAVAVILRHQRLARLLEMGEVGLGPPIVQSSLVVEGRTLVVERMADLMADHRADGAVIVGVIGPGVIEGPLQDRRRKIKRILQRQIHRIHGLRRHRPLRPVHRLADAVKIEMIGEGFAAPLVAKGVALHHREAGIIMPVFRIADADIKAVQFLAGLCAGGGRHPGDRVQPLAPGRHDVLHHGLQFRLGGGRKIFRGIELAHRIAQRVVGRGDTTLPALGQDGGAQQRLGIEGKAFIDEGPGQVAGKMIEAMEGEVILPHTSAAWH